MPTNRLPEFITRLKSLEESMAAHLAEGVGVKNDIKWLKWLVMGITGGWGAVLVAIVIWALKR